VILWRLIADLSELKKYGIDDEGKIFKEHPEKTKTR